MNEGGLDLLWASHWWREGRQKCGAGIKTEVKTVTLVDCQSAFYVLLLGFAIALLAILSESLFHWFFRRKCGGSDERNPTPAGRQDVSDSPSKLSSNVQNGVLSLSLIHI